MSLFTGADAARIKAVFNHGGMKSAQEEVRRMRPMLSDQEVLSVIDELLKMQAGVQTGSNQSLAHNNTVEVRKPWRKSSGW